MSHTSGLPSAPGRGWSSAASAAVLLTFAWFALVAGLGEAALLLFRRYVLHRFTWSTVDVTWMAPVSNLVLTAVPAAGLALLAGWRRAWVPIPLLAATLALFTSMALLEVAFNGSLALWAVVLISLGIAVRLGGALMRDAGSFPALCHRTTPGLALLVLLLAAGHIASQAWQERRAIARIPPAMRPNILLVIWDTARASSLSLYGYLRPTTPELERLAGQGVVFDEAVAPAPWTLPSHGTMFTGHWPHELSARWHTPLDGQYRTLAESLRDQGYVTAGFVGNHFYATRESGLDRGFLHYEAISRNGAQILRSSLLGQVVESMVDHRRYHYDPERKTHRKRAGEVRKSFLTWLPRAGDRPWFAFLNFFDAHQPYQPPKPWNRRLTTGRQHVDRYDQSLLYLDHELASLLRELGARHEMENTLVIVASDHGEQFGHHELFGHGNGLYRRLVRVPLLILWPGRVPSGIRVSRPVSLRDLPETILDLVGLPDPAFPGTTLREAWREDGRYPDTIFTEVERAINRPLAPAARGPMQSLFAGGMHYIRRGDGREQLFDVTSDPSEYTNLADSARYAGTLRAFQRALPRFYPGADTLAFRGGSVGHTR